MKTKKLGNSGMEITAIGLGTWAIGGPWTYGWGSQDDDESVGAILRALELGINWIDTAAAYGLGHSEEIVARALAQWKGPRPYVFTKCGTLSDGNGRVYRDLSAASVRREVEASLRRLKVDAIDLYQCHWPVSGNLAETVEGWTEMARLQKQGKLRAIGVSNFSVEELEAVGRVAPVASLQPPYSLLRREIEAAQLPYCLEHGIGVLAYSPMASGLLSGAMTAERIASLPEDDWRKSNPEFRAPKLSANLALVERLRRVGVRHGAGPGEVAIAWTLRNRAVTAAIVGARRAGQVDGFIRAASLELTDADAAEIEGGQ
jgi:aryl-alcohol dehydrogenase-like predicted oxidoreductase